MGLQLLKFLFFVLPAVYAADLTCPGAVTIDQKSGHFPSDGLSVFPASYSCDVPFTIPDGWVVKIIVQTNVNSSVSQDYLVIQDSAGVINEFNVPGEFAFYAAATYSKLSITTKTATSSFYFSWQFVDVTTYKPMQNPTGTIMKLDLTPLTFYRFVSPDGPVTFHVANLNRTEDTTLSTIYVYDGDDLKNSKYIGNLYQFTSSKDTLKSSGKSLILVNFYAYNTGSYGVANNYNDISNYIAYKLLLLTKAGALQGQLTVTGGSSAFTFYCVDAQEVYLDSLVMVDKNIEGQTLKFQPMTPSDRKGILFGYDASTQSGNEVPQQIATNLFTMIVSKCETNVHFTSGPLPIWEISYPGRTGVIISPNLWNPTASPKYNAHFSSGLTLTYYFNIQSLVVSEQNTAFRVQLDVNSLTFDHSVNNQARLANSTSMATTFNGTNTGSSFVMTFEMQDPNPAPSTTKSPSPSSTAPHVETTTRSARSYSNLIFSSIFVIVSFTW